MIDKSYQKIEKENGEFETGKLISVIVTYLNN